MKRKFTIAAYLTIIIFLTAGCMASERLVGTSEGCIAPGIAAADLNGTIRTLNQLQGKLTLVEFWTSSSVQARKNHAVISALCEKYGNSQFTKGDGFCVYSVCLDKYVDSWKKAVKEDRLMADCIVHDEGYWNSTSALTYGINDLPKYYLVDGDGVIIRTFIIIPELENTLQTYLVKNPRKKHATDEKEEKMTEMQTAPVQPTE